MQQCLGEMKITITRKVMIKQRETKNQEKKRLAVHDLESL